MSYCVNCGDEYSKRSGVCSSCCYDQVIPKEIIESELVRYKNGPDEGGITFGYPGEKVALILSVFVAGIVAVFLGVVSFGLFFLILIIGLVQLKINHISLRKNNILVSDSQFPKVFALSKIAAHRLKLPLPEVYVYNYSDFNAYTMGFYRYGFIVVSSAMVKEFRPEELLFVIGHEMGHIKKYHTTKLSLLNPAKTGIAGFLIAPIMKWIFNVWSVKAEYTADQGGLIACKNVNAAVSALSKLAGGPEIGKEVDLSQADKEDKSEEKEAWGNLLEYLGTHPYISNRIQQLRDFDRALSR